MKRLLSVIVASAACFCVAFGQGYRQMSVEEMFSLLDQNNTSMRVQASAVEASEQGIDVARRQRLPDIETALSVSYNGNIVLMDRGFDNAHGYSSPHFGNSFSLMVNQVVYSGGALSAGVRLAELQKEQSEATATLTRQQVRFLALGQYLDLYKLTNRQKVYESNIALTETLIEDIKAKHAEGMALKNDVTRYELQLETLKLGLRKVQDLCSVKNHELCVSLGIEEERLLPVSDIADETLEPDLNTVAAEQAWQTDALVFSPHIRLSAIGTQMAEQNLRQAKSEMLPKVGLFAADTFDGPITYEVPALDKNINVWYFGVGVSYPLSSLYKSNKKVKKAQTELRRSREQQTLAEESLNTAVQDAYTSYQQAFVELDTQKKSVLLAQQNYQVVSDRYLNQLSLITDMVDASNIKLNAELLEVDARINIIYAYYKMKYVSGTL